MNSILTQLEFELEKFDVQKNSIETIFIGGGTPSTVEPKLYEPFFKKLQPYLKKDAEITTEANPNSASFEWLKGMSQLGVTRTSFGVQSFDEKKLNYLGRNHTSKDAQKAILDAHKVGFKNISLDIIYDTHHDTKKLLQDDLDIAFSLPINHLSAYSLTIEKATKFYHDKTQPKDDESLAFWFVQNIKQKLPQYEISNFGTYHSLHNIGYWKLKNYIGIGSGAVGFLKNKRYYPTTNVKNYIHSPLTQREELLSSEDIKTEKIFLGLRSIVGVSKELLPTKKTDILLHENKLYEKNGRVYNPNYFLADEISLFLMQL